MMLGLGHPLPIVCLCLSYVGTLSVGVAMSSRSNCLPGVS
jgi:hypothetical protein